MRKSFLVVSSFLFVFTLFFMSALPVLADDDSSESSNFIQRREELRKEAEDRYEERIQKREEVREELEEKRQEFREHLAEIKDERKQKIVENLAEKLDSVNERWVKHWGEILSRLSELLAKIESRTAKVAAAGVDVSQVNEKIAAAEIAIDNAQSALDAQADNTYVITLSSENRLGEDVQSITSQLRVDIKETHEVIKAARESVRSALLELKNLIKNENHELPENE